MSNTIQIKRGSGVPTEDKLAEGELGWDMNDGGLYIGNGSTSTTEKAKLVKASPVFQSVYQSLEYEYTNRISGNTGYFNDKIIEFADKAQTVLIIFQMNKSIYSEGTWSSNEYFSSFLIPVSDSEIEYFITCIDNSNPPKTCVLKFKVSNLKIQLLSVTPSSGDCALSVNDVVKQSTKWRFKFNIYK